MEYSQRLAAENLQEVTSGTRSITRPTHHPERYDRTRYNLDHSRNYPPAAPLRIACDNRSEDARVCNSNGVSGGLHQ